VEKLIPQARLYSKENLLVCEINGRELLIGTFPISIDYEDFNQLASSEDVANEAWLIHETLPDRRLILCVDRLDYTKGILDRLEALRTLLIRYPQWHHKFTLIQVVVPSRIDILGYQELKVEIDTLVGEINSRFTKKGWVPIHYMFRSLSKTQLLAYYRTCEVALVTPIKDGMNLVAKEYIASNIDCNGVLILSEFAGCCAELHEEALVVNPYDVDGMANAIVEAFNMEPQERNRRMTKLRSNVKNHDILYWIESFLSAAIHKNLRDFPLVLEYVPKEL
jgi:trehalose 6-phosphate synthase